MEDNSWLRTNTSNFEIVFHPNLARLSRDKLSIVIGKLLKSIEV